MVWNTPVKTCFTVQNVQEENTKLQHDLHAVQTPVDEEDACVLQQRQDDEHTHRQGSQHQQQQQQQQNLKHSFR